MNDTHKDFKREPSKPHQCLHFSYETGVRCRAIAMHNHYMCYAHHNDDIPTVITNEPFLIERLDTRDDIQCVYLEVIARLASNRMDFRRAGLIGYHLQGALQNLNAAPNHVLKSTPDPIDLEDGPPDPELLRAARLAQGDLPDEEDEEDNIPSRDAEEPHHQIGRDFSPGSPAAKTDTGFSPCDMPSLASPTAATNNAKRPTDNGERTTDNGDWTTDNATAPPPAKQPEGYPAPTPPPVKRPFPVPHSCFAPPDFESRRDAAKQSTTLPTLHAVAEPTSSRALARQAPHEVPRSAPRPSIMVSP